MQSFFNENRDSWQLTRPFNKVDFCMSNNCQPISFCFGHVDDHDDDDDDDADDDDDDDDADDDDDDDII